MGWVGLTCCVSCYTLAAVVCVCVYACICNYYQCVSFRLFHFACFLVYAVSYPFHCAYSPSKTAKAARFRNQWIS